MAVTKKNIPKAKKARKLSFTHRPETLSLEEWQKGLRRQIAETTPFGIKPSIYNPGTYSVISTTSGNEYKVVYRGEESVWNYCSCMDFRTNQLATCKHLEAVRHWVNGKRNRLTSDLPPYTSVYLSYRGERNIYLRIGTDNSDEFKKLGAPYFTKAGKLRKGAEKNLPKFLKEAARINDTFRIYPDALDFLTTLRDAEIRNKIVSGITNEELENLLHTSLYPYQKEGILFCFKAGKAVIADEMGLGKTVQAIGAAELLCRKGLVSSVLVVCPTSLKYQWKKEIEKFTDSSCMVIEGDHFKRRMQYKASEFYKIVSYNCMCNDVKIMKGLEGFDLVIYDEVQRLKNWNTQIAKATSKVKSDYTIALSGTPLENKLEELYSVMQLVDQYKLGPLYRFMDSSIITSDNGKIIGYRNLNKIGEKLAGVLLRRTKAQVALQLPKRLNKTLFVPMTREQREIHSSCQSSVGQIIAKWNRFHFLSETDRKRLLLLMSQMRMVCDSTFILDQKHRHDTKVDEIINIINDTVESGDEKIVVFSQWERMTRLIASELDNMGVGYEYLHGGVPSIKRRALTENFSEKPESRVFISTDAGATGLNLQVASIIINVDLPWNPAVLEQRVGRIFRIGQQRNIQVINLVSSDTIEERMLSTLHFKNNLFQGILGDGEDTIFLEDSKLEKIMGVVKGYATEQNDTLPENEETPENEIPEDYDRTENDNCEDEDDNWDNADDPSTGEDMGNEITDSNASLELSTKGSDIPHSEKLVKEGVSFLSGLSKTLKSPEATKKLVDTIVKTDPNTGQTSINIPIPDKETVTHLFSILGKFLGSAGNS